MMTLLDKLLGIWRPAAYHGSGKNRNYFEGWYFKLVDASQKNVFALIPGVFFADKSYDSHTFIQILEGRKHFSTYHRYPISDFEASSKELHIKIGPNIFRSDKLELEVHDTERSIEGKIFFGDLKPWPVKMTSPGVMGWYAFVPFMECYHDIISLDHSLSGSLLSNGEEIVFNGGRGYIEKDWGKSFPEAYVWIQSNHFQKKGISLSASIAKIPWLNGFFRGFIIGLLIDGNLYRFTTYTDAKLNFLKLTDNHVAFEVENRRYRLKVNAMRNEGGLLHAPLKKSMGNRISESLATIVKVRLSKRGRDTETVIYEDSSVVAALEVNGKLEDIVNL